MGIAHSLITFVNESRALRFSKRSINALIFLAVTRHKLSLYHYLLPLTYQNRKSYLVAVDY